MQAKYPYRNANPSGVFKGKFSFGGAGFARLTALCAVYFFSAFAHADGSPVVSKRTAGMVAADTPEASVAGAEILRQGGNAIDAAVATALALGVVSPAGSGLGGGGFAVIWCAKEQRAYVLDFRESAPAAAKSDMFVMNGVVDPIKSQIGGLAVAVPGEPAGLAELETKYGKLGLAKVVKPAVKLARAGFVVSSRLAGEVARNRQAGGAAELFAPFEKEGMHAKRDELAKTLEAFGAYGVDAIYRGEVGKAIVDVIKAAGGIVTIEDLAAYKPIWRTPIEGHFRGHEVWGAPPPAGGVTAIEALQVLDALPALDRAGSPLTLHRIAESLKHAFADRARVLGDATFVDVPTAHLIDAEYARTLARRLSDTHVLKSTEYGDKSVTAAPTADHGTSHLCVIDGEGNVVALTTTINLPFGSRLSARGILLNDQMDDFSAQPAAPNAFHLIGSFANAIAPHKRPASSMTPLILIKDGKPVMCLGGSGGPHIVSAVVQTIVNVIDFGKDAQAAISAPRIHTQWVPDEVLAEPDVSHDAIEGLEKRGQKMKPMKVMGAVQAIVVKDDHLEGASDPRKGGKPAF